MMDTVVNITKSKQAKLTAKDLANSLVLVNRTSPTYGMAAVPTSGITVSPPGDVHGSMHGAVPMSWANDGSLTMDGNESITMLRGYGLRLGPGQDAAKAHGI